MAKVLKALPEGTHPMTQFSTAVLSLQVPTGPQCSAMCKGHCSCLVFTRATDGIFECMSAGMDIYLHDGLIEDLPSVAVAVEKSRVSSKLVTPLVTATCHLPCQVTHTMTRSR